MFEAQSLSGMENEQKRQHLVSSTVCILTLCTGNGQGKSTLVFRETSLLVLLLTVAEQRSADVVGSTWNTENTTEGLLTLSPLLNTTMSTGATADEGACNMNQVVASTNHHCSR